MDFGYSLSLASLSLGLGRAACNERKRGVDPHLLVILIAVFVGSDDKGLVCHRVPPLGRPLGQLRSI